jgi:hypothetical protein
MNKDIYYKGFKEELEHFKRTKIPRCIHCKKNFENAIDIHTGKVRKYLWKPTCKCFGNIRLSIG